MGARRFPLKNHAAIGLNGYGQAARKEGLMGFTVEDMLTVSHERYRMDLIAGKGGWSNSISWLLMLEDLTITQNFTGKELAVTTGLGFQTGEKLMDLVKALVRQGASGLIVNTGMYIHKIPAYVAAYCDENDLPLLTVPWDVILADMIKDLSVRIFLQGYTDEQISEALIHAIEDPDGRDQYVRHLLPYFDVDGSFQVVLLHTDGLDRMDTVERRRLSYRMQLYLSNLTHNGHFFYYASTFVIIINAVEETVVRDILHHFRRNLKMRMPDRQISIGVSGEILDITRLHIAYHRAQAALSMARDTGRDLVRFPEMGLYRILYSVTDKDLLRTFCEHTLSPLIDYDKAHNACYVETLEQYLKYDGSIQAVSDAMFTHRNTILYRMNNIRKLLDIQLDTQEQKLTCQIACLIRHMRL